MLAMEMWKFHICCLVLGYLLLATSPTHGQESETRYTTGGWETFTNNITSIACALTLPDNFICYYDNSSSTTPIPTENCKIPSSLLPYYCHFEVSITSKNQSGIYKLSYFMTESNFGEDTFYVYLHTDSIPTNTLNVVENENMYLLLEDSFGSADDRKCEVVYRNGTSDIVLDSSWKSPNHWGKEDECGFKIEGVSTSDEKVLKLRMSSRKAAYTYAEFNVNVIQLDEIDTGEKDPLTWILGEKGTLYDSTNQYIRHCELWNPKKEMVQNGSYCSYTQNTVTDADAGEWTFVYRVEGKLLEDKAVQEVRVITKRDVEVSISSSERIANGTSLLCSVYTSPVVECNFIRPDGTVLVLSEGIGHAGYSYFGDGFGKGDCGLTIHKVQDNDKGMWKCTVSDGITTRFGFLNVSANVSDVKVETNQSLVFVQHPGVLTLSCSTQTAAEYCWFRHPSGVPLRFSTDRVFLDYIQSYWYEDTLAQGVCTIRVETSSSSEDSGNWTCNLGLPGISNEEYVVPITVGVSETNVISLEKEVVVSEDSALLKCYSVPLETPVDYCRFIRPDGKGFFFDPQSNGSTVLGRYQYEGGGLEKGECGLKIVSEINKDEDLGKWMCLARLQARNSEGLDFITLKEEGGLSKGAIAGIELRNGALIGGIAFLIAHWRKSI